MRRTDILERKEDILKWIGEDLPNAEIARRLACKVDTLKSYYTKMGMHLKSWEKKDHPMLMTCPNI